MSVEGEERELVWWRDGADIAEEGERRREVRGGGREKGDEGENRREEGKGRYGFWVLLTEVS